MERIAIVGAGKIGSMIAELLVGSGDYAVTVIARSQSALDRLETAATVTTLYRNVGLAGDTAALYHDSLIPLARQDFSVALIAYQSGKIDFTTLSEALLRAYTARVAYLQAANQYLAAQVALEQAAGGPVSK